MMMSIRAPAAAGLCRAPLRPAGGRRALLVRAEIGGGPEDRKTPGAPEPPRKDISDVPTPTSARGVGEAVREAAPSYAPAFQAAPIAPTFSRRREVFAGRWAMLGFAAACAWEILTPNHLGPMGITAALTGWSIPTVKLVYAGFVTHGLLGLLWPGAPTFDPANTRDYNQRPQGPPGLAINPITHPARFFGCSPYFGFTKKNELLNGRIAMLGFFAALVNEAQTGLGPIGQVGWWLGAANPSDDWYRMAGYALMGFSVLMAGLAYTSGHAGTVQGEEDIY